MSAARNFAPSPWGWQTSGKPGGNGDYNVYVVDNDERKIAAVWGKRGEKLWTAALIAQAPDLYAYVLKRALAGDAEAQELVGEVDAMAARAEAA